MLKSILLAATIPLVAVPAVAEDGDTILVSARAPLTELQTGSSVTVLTAADVERLQVPMLVDVLRLQPGVTFSSNGGAGGFTAVRLRGAEGEQTTLVIDGVKVADPSSPGGGADFGTLGTQHIGRLEILRGPQSLAWGSQAIGGVIAIETLWPEEALALDGRVEGGSDNSWLARADAAGTLGPVKLAAGGNWQKTDGISAYAGGDERDGFESVGGNLRAEVELGAGFYTDLRGRIQDSQFDLDGGFPFGDTDDRSSSRELGGVAGLGWRSDNLKARIGWQLSDISRRTWTPGLDPETNNQFDGRIERLDARLDWTVTGWLGFSGGVERELTKSKSSSRFAPDPFEARSTLTGGFVQALLTPVEGLNVNAGLRHDDHSTFGGETTFAANASYRIGGGPLRLKASYGEGFKAPTLYQLYSDYGNESLLPEEAKGWDAGAELTLLDGTLRASATWFERTTRNLIVFIDCFGDPRAICTNRPWGTYDTVGRAKADGLELTLGADPIEGLTLDVQYSFTRSENRTEGDPRYGEQLLRRPKHSVSAVADYKAPSGWSIGTTLSHVSGSLNEDFDTWPSTIVTLKGYVLADIRAGFEISERLELYGRVTNLFDEQYQTVLNYGQPGRQAFVGLRVRY